MALGEMCVCAKNKVEKNIKFEPYILCVKVLERPYLLKVVVWHNTDSILNKLST